MRQPAKPQEDPALKVVTLAFERGKKGKSPNCLRQFGLFISSRTQNTRGIA